MRAIRIRDRISVWLHIESREDVLASYGALALAAAGAVFTLVAVRPF